MIGAIAGDVIGAVYEHGPPVSPDFPLFSRGSRFTDDTVLTVAIAEALRTGENRFAEALRLWGRRYPNAGYGGMFRRWLREDDAGPYNSFGNGSAMRVAPVAWALDSLEDVLDVATRTAAVTHDHREGIRGAQAIAGAVFLARCGARKTEVRDLLEVRFAYDCSASLAELRARGGFDVTCQGTVPAAAVAFLHSADFEGAVRNAVSFGGDTDTNACIAGAIAEAFYGGVPPAIQQEVLPRLDEPLRNEVRSFSEAFGVPGFSCEIQ